MGTLRYTVGGYGGDANKNIPGVGDRASGAFTTSTAAADITGLSLHTGEVFFASASEPMWIRFGGNAAAVGTGWYLDQDVRFEFEVGPGYNGAVSTIDVS